MLWKMMHINLWLKRPSRTLTIFGTVKWDTEKDSGFMGCLWDAKRKSYTIHLTARPILFTQTWKDGLELRACYILVGEGGYFQVGSRTKPMEFLAGNATRSLIPWIHAVPWVLPETVASVSLITVLNAVYEPCNDWKLQGSMFFPPALWWVVWFQASCDNLYQATLKAMGVIIGP